MKHLTIILTLLLIPTVGLFAAKKTGQAVAPPTSITVSCTTCTSGQPITISVQGFTGGANATLNVTGPYTAVTFVQIDNNGQWSVTYLTGLHFPAGTYQASVSQPASGKFAATSFTIQ